MISRRNQSRPSTTQRRSSTMALFLATTALTLVALTIGSCKETQQPITPVSQNNAWDPSVESLTFKIETADGDLSPLRLIATDITWAPGSGILRAKVAVHNAGREAVLGLSGVEVFDFVPADVQPLNAVCGIIPEAPCFYEYSGTYGDDDRLDPGETSEALEWQILNIRGEGFAFRARLLGNPNPGGRIAGVVFHDINRNGTRETNEEGLPGIFVALGPMRFAPVQTDANGHFELRAPEPGIYTVHKQTQNGWEPTTPTDMQVVVFRDINGNLSNFLSADFGCWPREVPPGPGIGGVVFLDSNRDGQRDPNEVGIPGIVISLAPFPPDSRDETCGLDPPGHFPWQRPSSVVTDHDGNWSMLASDITCDLPWLVQRGRHSEIIVKQPLPLLIGTTPSNHVVFNQTGPAGQVQGDFGMAPPDTSRPEPILIVEGFVFVDTNENGIRDTTEHGAPGVRLSLLSPCDRLESTWTNYLGYYRFEPPATEFCEIGGVAVSASPDRTTTANPVLFPPPKEPGIHWIKADFGVRP
jgi:hypothetical protein